MELKVTLVACPQFLEPPIRNPFNGIERSLLNRYGWCCSHPSTNPFNGIESTQPHPVTSRQPLQTNPFNGIESRTLTGAPAPALSNGIHSMELKAYLSLTLNINVNGISRIHSMELKV